jgi:hypothetical protein
VKAAEIARALHGRKSGAGWIARCPAHHDKDPSLSLHGADGKVLVHCHAGVTLTGDMKGDTITVSKIAMPAKK